MAGSTPATRSCIFITPSQASIDSAREPIAVLTASPQGSCYSGEMPVDAEIASRSGWLLVAQGRRAGDMATAPFIPMPVPTVEPLPPAQPPSQPRQAIAAQVPQEIQPQNVVASPPRNDGDEWEIQYFMDRDQDSAPATITHQLVGSPKLNWSASDETIDLPDRNYRIVFTGTFEFPQTHSYLFALNVKGSARVWINDPLRAGPPAIDAYQIGAKRRGLHRLPVSAGDTTITVEYYSDGGLASLTLDWYPDPKRNDYWLGRYYDNENMNSPPVMIRHDNTLSFTWAGEPGLGVKPDNFSVQWLRDVIVPKNGYTCRMSIEANDKVRVFVDAVQVPELSNWDGPNAWDRTAKIAGGRHLIEVHFVHRSGPAKIQLICEL